MTKKRVLVFPCGSEIALEVYRSLKNSIHFELIGANSVSDHGRFVFENYIEGVPFVSDEGFIPAMAEIVKRERIDFIYPAMDSVIAALKTHEEELGSIVIASPAETAEICLSKEKTYEALKGAVRLPAVYTEESVPSFPVFCKPKVGYGARGAKKVNHADELREQLAEHPDSMILEYLPGEEYTLDCFTNSRGELLFCGARVRGRIANGISVYTCPVADDAEFQAAAAAINARLRFRGAWFVQLKRDAAGKLTLLEVASRLGGSSALFRARGINFAQLSLFDAMGLPVGIIDNGYPLEMDRALDNRYKLDIGYGEVYLDYDDTLILEGKYYNPEIMAFLYTCKNRGVKLTILSAHEGPLDEELRRFRLDGLFDRVIQIKKGENKADFIDNTNAIFIDDSYAERLRVFKGAGIPVFSLDMVQALM